jgi:hypothetical protein
MNFSLLFGFSLTNESSQAKKTSSPFGGVYHKALHSRNGMGTSGTVGYYARVHAVSLSLGGQVALQLLGAVT